MPIQLPLQPGIDLPALPDDPPTLTDVVAARSYQARVEEAIGWSFTLFIKTSVASNPISASQPGAPNAPTEFDAARADIYKTTIIMAYCAASSELRQLEYCLSYAEY